MASDRLTDGVRIAQLLASEVSGDGGRLRDLALADADPDVEPTADGALAYRIGLDAEDGRDRKPVADVYVHPDRVRIEFRVAVEEAADAAADADLRVRPKAVRPPRALVFVEDGAQVKRALPVFSAVVDAE